MGASSKEASKRHYEANKEAYRERKRVRQAQMYEYMRELKANTECMDCGVLYPHYVMDFDHRDPTQKVGAVSRVLKNGSWTKLFEEIEKCDIVCANCHRIRTYE